LKRQQYRALEQQSQQTVAINQDYDIDARIGLGYDGIGDVHWEEVGEVFSSYSLTPSDMNLPWMFARSRSKSISAPPSPTHGILKTSSTSPPSSPKHSVSLQPQKSTKISFAEQPQVQQLPPSPLGSKPGSKQSGRRKSLLRKGRRGGFQVPSYQINQQDSQHEEMKELAKLQHNYKGYTASDSRDEYVKKKAMDLSLVCIWSSLGIFRF
jgi:hypothetical protein